MGAAALGKWPEREEAEAGGEAPPGRATPSRSAYALRPGEALRRKTNQPTREVTEGPVRRSQRQRGGPRVQSREPRAARRLTPHPPPCPSALLSWRGPASPAPAIRPGDCERPHDGAGWLAVAR